MKINRITIKNFKVFGEITFDFESVDFLMFDGPNGFGKTTFYDAVELLITGEIRRYKVLSHALVDGRATFSENPFLFTGRPDGDIEIKGEFLVGEQRLFLARVCRNPEIEASANFTNFQLLKLRDFEDQAGERVADEPEFLTGLFGKNYKENFEFLNYIEQEDNAYLLKNNEKTKKNLISHLFNVQEFQSQMDRVNVVREKIKPLCDNLSKKAIADSRLRLKSLEESLSTSDEIPYTKVFSDREHPWDEKEIDFGLISYPSLLGPEGTVTALERLVKNRQQFLNLITNESLEALIDQNGQLETFVNYYGFLDQRDRLSELAGLKEKIQKFVEGCTDAEVVDFAEGLFVLNEDLQSIIDKDLALRYEEKLSELEGILERSSELGKVLSSLELSRNTLIKNFQAFMDLSGNDTQECPLCGYDWEHAHTEGVDEINMLNEQIKIQTFSIDKLLADNQVTFSTSFQKFQQQEVAAVISALEQYLKNHPIDLAFVNRLKRANKSALEETAKKLLEFEIDFRPYLITEQGVEIEDQVVGIIQRLNDKKNEVDENLAPQNLRQAFQYYFQGSGQLLMEMEESTVASKIEYINWQFSIFQNADIKDLRTEIEKEQSQFDQAKKVFDDLKKIHDIHKESLAKYNSDLIKDIEVLFHIYSGRIIQDFQGGLGLFISNRNGIKFLTNPNKSFDAMFSMSSGQIAALIISFTLALNKKYSQNRVLFIDDPVQTMDELNIAGLVELLRNDFADRQIFISTHEDRMSTYMRYKFEKYGLMTRRINMKQVYNLMG